ncbi:hypothetical protein PIROE2DRAFT_58787 [Piromyces sp. E2]|nr:hypothetical protein PIROE2DRAFT_58787 [Piromyces sp. E2]|eukprot:OUM67399.1 hypothetical protein PIROE2DRAFT_58787 [Piromyces sp. E2]
MTKKMKTVVKVTQKKVVKKIVHKNSYNYPIYNVSWEKNFIALGSENGKVNLLKVSNEALENSEGTIAPDEETLCEMQSLNTKVMPSLPNQFVFSQRVHSVNLNPTPIWKCSSSKKNIEITDIAWNPFVPYWIAVSRSDAVVNIWDLRYNKGHVGQVNGHYHSIKSVNNISQKKKKKKKKKKKYDSLQSLERKVELNNYERNIGKAYKNIISLSKLQKEESVLADLIDICTPYPEIKAENWEFPPLQKSEENLDNHCEQKYITQFKNDLEKYSHKLPPGYASQEEKWLGGINEELKDEIQIVQLRINALSSIKSNKWEFIIENKDKLLEVLEKDQLFMEADEIKQMISCLLPHDHVTALKIGLELNKMFDEQEDRDYSDLTAINHILLFPTVYDTDDNMITLIPELESNMSRNSVDPTVLVDPSTHMYSKNILLKVFIDDEESVNKIPMHAYHSLTNLLQDPTLIIPLLELEIKIDEIVNNKDLSKEDIDTRIINVIKEKYIIKDVPQDKKDEDDNENPLSRAFTTAHQRNSLSVTTNRLYMDALLRNSMFEEFFYTSMDLFMQYFQLDFSRTIISTIDRVALAKVKEYIDQIYQKIASDITDVINDIQQIQEFNEESFDQLFKKLTDNILTVADLIALLNKIGVVCANGIQIIPLLDDKGGIFFNYTQSFLIELIEQLSSSLYSFIATVKIISEKTNFGFSTE